MNSGIDDAIPPPSTIGTSGWTRLQSSAIRLIQEYWVMMPPRPITSGLSRPSFSTTLASAHLTNVSSESLIGARRSAFKSSTSTVWPSIAATAPT